MAGPPERAREKERERERQRERDTERVCGDGLFKPELLESELGSLGLLAGA